MKIDLQKTPNSLSAGEPQKRVFLVDDHPLVREWLTQVIEQQGDMAICGEASDASEALDKIVKRPPDIAIVDIALKNSHGVTLVKDIRAQLPDLPVLVLSMHDESLYAERVLRAGAKGYITKQEATRNIMLAIRQVLKGEIYVSEVMASRMVHKLVAGRGVEQRTTVERLTDRELEVFQLIGRGFGTRKIAEELHLGIKTVESYRARIKDKLNIEDGTQLLQQAIQWVHNLKDEK